MSKPQVHIVSPHRDDATFSCAVLTCACLAQADITIINTFTVSNYAPYSPQTEQEGVAQVSELRRQEDQEMLAILGSKSFATGDCGHVSELDLELFDAPLRLSKNLHWVQSGALFAQEFEEEVSSLTRILASVIREPSCVLLPLGLGGTGLNGHIDHRIARDAGLRCVPIERIAFYEDQPYAARMTPEDRSVAVSTFLPDSHQPYTITYPGGVSTKRLLSGQYSSQVNPETVEEMCDYAEKLDGGEVVYVSTAGRLLLEAALKSKLPPIGVR